MGKATQGRLENHPALEKRVPHFRRNDGFLCSWEKVSEIRGMLLANEVPAAAHAGATAQCEVTVPAQSTDVRPEKSSFFQASAITTTVSGGTTETLSDRQLVDWRQSGSQ